MSACDRHNAGGGNDGLAIHQSVHAQKKDGAAVFVVFDKVDNMMGGQECAKFIDVERGAQPIDGSRNVLPKHGYDGISQSEWVLDSERMKRSF